jgi:hypothetical protein
MTARTFWLLLTASLVTLATATQPSFDRFRRNGRPVDPVPMLYRRFFFVA